MNGAQAMIKALKDQGVDVCFANPGTSEMHMVQALDATPEFRSVLVLFEGVASGAADGYARMAGKPASTVLHLGPGLGNALANIHNARRGNSPMVNLVGDHPQYHLPYDAPLTSDLDAYAKAAGKWVAHSKSSESLGASAAEALAAAKSANGRPVTLIVHADHSWGENSGAVAPVVAPEPAAKVTDEMIALAIDRLTSGKPCALLVGDRGAWGEGIELLTRITTKTVARPIVECFATRISRGAGRPEVQRMPYFPEMMEDFLKGTAHLLVLGCKKPTAFFGYEGKPSLVEPEGCEITLLGDEHSDVLDALTRIQAGVDAASAEPRRRGKMAMPVKQGPTCLMGIGATLAQHLPENAVIIDEAITSGGLLYPLTEGANAHEWLNCSGGSIGWGMSAGVGAAIACPDRKVVTLHGDGGAMYTVQALWTQARENLDVTTVIFANNAYCILGAELLRTGLAGNTGASGRQLLSLDNPALDWVKLAEGMGVKATCATTNAEFEEAFKDAMATSGPKLIVAPIPPIG